METNKVDSFGPIIGHYKTPNALFMVTVYTKTTSDFPGKHVARLSVIKEGSVFKTPFAVVSEDLATVRNGIPGTMANIGREPGDDPVIMEVWL